jgi:hypothetical protein
LRAAGVKFVRELDEESALAKHDLDVVPNQPMLVQILGAMPGVEAPCGCVGRLNIDTDP